MSVFVVSDDAINNILSWLYWNAQRSHAASHGIRSLKKLGYDILNDLPDERNGILMAGNAMLDFNVRAWNRRYGKDEESRPFIPCQGMPPNRIQALKSMQCWEYQCCEIEAEPLFEAMVGIQNLLMNEIISDLPEYQKARWD